MIRLFRLLLLIWALMVTKDMMCVNAPPLISLSFPRPSPAVFDRIRTVRNTTCEKCPDPGFEAVPIVQNINMLFKKSCMDTNYTILYVKPVTISLGCTCAKKDWTICKLCLHACTFDKLSNMTISELQYVHIMNTCIFHLWKPNVMTVS